MYEDDKCDILRLEKIKARLKRYDIHSEGSNQKVSLSAQPCLQHGQPDMADIVFTLKGRQFIQFVCFIIQFKFKLLNIEDIR